MSGGQWRARPRVVVSDEIRATIIDHGISLREAGFRMQPNLQLCGFSGKTTGKMCILQ